MSFAIGTRVETEKNGKGVVAFCGTTQFQDGEWIGVRLDEPNGKNNGTVKGVEYFSCEDNHGLFIRPTMLKVEGATGRTRPSSAMKAPSGGLRADVSGKNSRKPSPLSTPKMSPAPSMEKLSKTTSQRKSSSSRLPEPASEQKASIRRETSNVSQSSRELSFVGQKPPASAAKKTAAPPTNEAPPPENDTVQSRVKKMEESATVPMVPPSPVHIPTGMDEGTEKEYMLAQIKDLTEKLETLRMKRKEEQGKLGELERVKVQLQSLQEVKQKLMDQNLEVLRQLEESKRETSEMRAWREANQEEMGNAAEELEMALIDKEMAEERCEMLRKDLEDANEKMEELTADLEILREEMSLAGQGQAAGGVAAGNSVQMKQMEQQNERMKEALIKLRDVHATEKAAREEQEKQLEVLTAENNELVRALEQARRVAAEAEGRIIDYQEQVEAAMGAEEMILALTTKNMDMEEKIAALEQEKEDMEALRDMDEQIAEAQKQVEKDLLRDIEAEQIRFSELLQKLKQEEKHSDDLMATIMKFRQRTCELNEEIQDLKDKVLRYEEQLIGEQSEEKSMASMVSQLQVNAQRSFAESVERQLSNVELEYAKKQIGYLKAFLPDNFNKAGGDHDAVVLNVLFPRLIAKSTLFCKLVAEKFPHVPGGVRREHVTKSHKAEQWAHVARVAHACHALNAVCGQFESAIQELSVERLARLSQLQPEMVVHEKTLDGYLEVLRQSRFDENTALDNMHRAIAYFQNVFSVHVGGDGFSTNSWVSSLCQQLLDGTTWAKMNTQRILYFLTPDMDSSDIHSFVVQLNGVLDKCQQMVMKATKSVPTEKHLKLTPQFTDELQAAISNLSRFCELLHETCGIASVQMNINPDLAGLDATRMREMLHGVVEKMAGSITLEKALDPVSKLLSSVESSLSTVVSLLADGSMEEAEQKEKRVAFPPMLERAHLRKQSAAEAEGLRWQLEKKDNEILELKKNIKARMDDISYFKLKVDMAEARIDSSGKQESTKTQNLETRLGEVTQELKKKTIEFDEQLEKLHLRLREAEKENEELKKNHTNMTKRALLQGIQSMESRAALSPSTPSTPTGNSSVASMVGRAEVRLMEHQLAEAQASMRAAQREIMELKVANTVACGTGGALRVPDVVCGPETLRAHQQDKELEDIYREAEAFVEEELKYLYYIPDWRRPKHLREEDEANFEREKENFYSRVQSCRRRLHMYWAKNHPGKPLVPFSQIFNQKEEEPVKATAKKPEMTPDEEIRSILAKWGSVKV